MSKNVLDDYIMAHVDFTDEQQTLMTKICKDLSDDELKTLRDILSEINREYY